MPASPPNSHVEGRKRLVRVIDLPRRRLADPAERRQRNVSEKLAEHGREALGAEAADFLVGGECQHEWTGETRDSDLPGRDHRLRQEGLHIGRAAPVDALVADLEHESVARPTRLPLPRHGVRVAGDQQATGLGRAGEGDEVGLGDAARLPALAANEKALRVQPIREQIDGPDVAERARGVAGDQATGEVDERLSQALTPGSVRFAEIVPMGRGGLYRAAPAG